MAEGGEEENDSGDEGEEEDPATLEANRLRLEEQARKYLAAQTHEVIIPSYSAWLTTRVFRQVSQASQLAHITSVNVFGIL